MISSADSGSETGETDGDREAGQEPDGNPEITHLFLPACAGSYQIFTDKAGGARAVKMTEGAAEQSGVTLAISIDGLAQWLFGFRPLTGDCSRRRQRQQNPPSVLDRGYPPHRRCIFR